MMKIKEFEKLVYLLFVASNVAATLLGIGVYLLAVDLLELNEIVAFAMATVVWLFISMVLGIRHTKAALRPTTSVYMALEHLAEAPSGNVPPNPDNHGISKDVVTQVLHDIYQLSSGQHSTQAKLSSSKDYLETILSLQSNGILVLDRNHKITYTNAKAVEYMPESISSPLGLTLEDVYSMEFSSGPTFADWLGDSQANKIQDRHLWERVKIEKTENTEHYYDVVADYSKNETHGVEIIVVLVDKTASYHADDDAVSFVSLAVHELRSPISMLRGYIEVFEDELSGALDEEQRLFMQKMTVAAGQLSTFVNNILNVSRVENDQLKVHLHEDTIYDALNSSKDDFTLRAEVRNRKLTYKIADGIPSVGLDRVGLYEVLSNLIDNAIKYSKDDGEIFVNARKLETGGVSITIQDFGVGIPESSLDSLFERFYRSHHTRDKVSGTGLGLFLSKKIIEAHGGAIWVKSSEGKGTTFGFDLPSYETMKSQSGDETPDDPTIVRSAHGWIKNHGKVRK